MTQWRGDVFMPFQSRLTAKGLKSDNYCSPGRAITGYNPNYSFTFPVTGEEVP